MTLEKVPMRLGRTWRDSLLVHEARLGMPPAVGEVIRISAGGLRQGDFRVFDIRHTLIDAVHLAELLVVDVSPPNTER